MTFSKKKVVIVEWEDASSTNGYYDKEHPEKATTVQARTVGFLVERGRKVVKVCGESFEDGDFRHVHSIPRGMVRKITELRR